MLVLLLSTILLAVAAAPSFAEARGRVYFPDAQSAGDPTYRPSTMLVAGDGSFIVKHARWKRWNGRTAKGHGVGVQGFVGLRHTRAPVQISLSRPRKACGVRVFTRAVFYWKNRKPRSVPRRWKWKLAQFSCRIR